MSRINSCFNWCGERAAHREPTGQNKDDPNVVIAHLCDKIYKLQVELADRLAHIDVLEAKILELKNIL